MTTPTTSSVPAVTDAVIGVLTAAVGFDVFEAWPGPEATAEMVFLSGVEWDEYRVPTIKTGRKARQEDYRLKFEVWVVLAEDTSPGRPKVSRDRAFELFGLVEDAFSEDPSVGLGYAANSIQWALAAPSDAGPIKFDNGHAYQIKGAVEVHARLS